MGVATSELARHAKVFQESLNLKVLCQYSQIDFLISMFSNIPESRNARALYLSLSDLLCTPYLLHNHQIFRILASASIQKNA